MRFFRGVFNYRQALSLYSREHNVHRSADGNHIKINMAAQKPVGLNADYGAVDKLMLCAKGGKGPLRCWSTGRTPKSQPPGMATCAFLYLPSRAPSR